MSGSVGMRLDGLKARRVLGGLSIVELAQKSNLSELQIKELEDGGNCMPHEAQRIMDALAPPTTFIANTLQSPTHCLLTGAPFLTGDTVTISGATGGISLPDINGTWVVTYLGAGSYSIPVDANGGTAYDPGATVRLDGATVGLSRL